jgi:hypothetical protein
MNNQIKSQQAAAKMIKISVLLIHLSFFVFKE